ncbi:MAG: tRNA (adenosine(37)-N6)-threonylcarbamoyltransferase complex ATPase subunit type 1 TsaE [Candidatus Saccharimonadales bacterium]
MASSYSFKSNSLEETVQLGDKIGQLLRGGEVIELISDLGGGKTALVRGIARGIGSNDQVMSPTFTISRIYRGKNLELHHFDFYRLEDPGIMADELSETISEQNISVVIEWADVVKGVLPDDRLSIEISATAENSRDIAIKSLGEYHDRLVKELSKELER